MKTVSGRAFSKSGQKQAQSEIKHEPTFKFDFSKFFDEEKISDFPGAVDF